MSKILIFFIFAIKMFMISSCTVRTDPAPVHNLYVDDKKEIIPYTTKSNQNSINKTEESDVTFTLDAKSLEDNYYADSEKILYHEVQKGETLEEIALNYNQMLFDIIKLNNLVSPYKIKEKQILKISIKSDIYQDDVRYNQSSQSSQSPQSSKIDNDKLKKNIDNQKNPSQKIASKKHSIIKPVEGKIVKNFGEKYSNKISKGINILTKINSKVHAASAGKVIYSSFDPFFGNLLIVNTLHDNIFHTYGHLKEVFVTRGDIVEKGDVIAIVGKTGKVDIEQLYFSIRQYKQAINPLDFLEYQEFDSSSKKTNKK